MTTTASEIVFSSVPSLTTCTQVTIAWTYAGTVSSTSSYPLVVTNIGVDQWNSSHSRFLSVLSRGTTDVNATLSLINPSTGQFPWSKVNVPQGRYRLDAYASGGVLSSNVFNVANGTDTSCLTVPSQSSVASSSTRSITYTSTPSPSSSQSSASNPSVTSPASVSGGSRVNGGIVAAGVITGLLALALVVLAVLWILRRRKLTARNATPTHSIKRTSKGFHDPSDSTGRILPLEAGNQDNSPQSSEEDFSSEKSVIIYDEVKPSLPPIAATRSHSKSSTSSRRPASMVAQPSLEFHETTQSMSSRRQPHRSLDSSPLPPGNIIPPSPSSPSYPRHPTDRVRRTSRKPVPVYDPSEFHGSEADDIPLSARSETSLGGKTAHYIIPDPPLEQKK